MTNLVQWIWDRFPSYFTEKDSYKVGGEGLLQRFIKSLSLELQENSLTPLENVFNLFDAEVIEEPLLVHLADFLGNPPDTFGNSLLYRKLLANIPYINKYKGTLKAYEYLFGIFNVSVEITEEEPHLITYDDGDSRYDDEPKLRYDDACPTCTGYTITINDPNGLSPELQGAFDDISKYNQLVRLIQYIEPINAQLRGITYVYSGGQLPENWWVLTTGVWSNSRYWKNDAIYKNNP
jgi:hypothetical protein